MATNDLLVGYTRRFAAPVDATATFPTLSSLQAYASNDLTAYVGQVCAVTGTNTVYLINNDKSVSAVGAGTSSGGFPLDGGYANTVYPTNDTFIVDGGTP